MTDTKKLIATPIEVSINGETLNILPFPFFRLTKVASKLAPIYSILQGFRAGDSVDYSDILAAGGDGLQEVLAMAAGKDQAWLDTIIDPAEGVALLEAVVQANKPSVKKIVEILAKHQLLGLTVPA